MRAAALLLMLTGCVTVPRTGQSSSGEPLSVDASYVTERWYERRQVGVEPVSAAPLFDDRPIVQLVASRWVPKQGEAAIDEEDFFRISGDADTANHIAAGREKAQWLYRAGWSLGILGLVGGVSGVVVQASAPRAMAPSTGVLVEAGATLAIGTGLALILAGSGSLRESHRFIDLVTAQRAAGAYNLRLGLATRPLKPFVLKGAGPVRDAETKSKPLEWQSGVSVKNEPEWQTRKPPLDDGPNP